MRGSNLAGGISKVQPSDDLTRDSGKCYSCSARAVKQVRVA